MSLRRENRYISMTEAEALVRAGGEELQPRVGEDKESEEILRQGILRSYQHDRRGSYLDVAPP